jgi:hypothetical protein
MAYRILSAAIVACLAGLAAADASAQTTSTYHSGCSRDKWTGAYNCRAEYDSPYSNTTTYCTSGRNGRSCETETVRKPQPRRAEPIIQDPNSTRIMDGHGPR